ncbi:hypothetical protein [Nonomuraea turcica]|uniref:hypothetical protein n=1 Tax=Nonomuraea sp. G32 TaxID=3067274 RepID=UPI00273BE68E|nr:hypothetical protein [Nonomuraea sp. G32]MDP4501029.1 hypothetical protein [Nonomuraea sp. G32]
MSRHPIRSLAGLTHAWDSPEMERPVYWRTLIGRNTWALLLITKGKPGEPPPRPELAPKMRISTEWARRTGADLTPEDLLHERITQHLKAHIQDEVEIDAARAASIATDATISMLAEHGIDIATLKRTDAL